MLLWAAGILSFVGYAVESLTPGEEASQDNVRM